MEEGVRGRHGVDGIKVLMRILPRLLNDVRLSRVRVMWDHNIYLGTRTSAQYAGESDYAKYLCAVAFAVVQYKKLY